MGARTCRFAALVAALAAGTGCGSNNAGKLVGKWKITPAGQVGRADPEFRAVYYIWAFDERGRHTYSEVVPTYKTSLAKVIKSGTYDLGRGDRVRIEAYGSGSGTIGGSLSTPEDFRARRNGPSSGEYRFCIDDDQLVVTDSLNESHTFTRVKE